MMLISKRCLFRYIFLVFFTCLVTLLLFLLSSPPSSSYPTFSPTLGTVAPQPDTIHPVVSCQILILILSKPANQENRALLRHSSYLAYPWLYNGSDIDFRYVFVLGKSGDSAVDERAAEEAEVYGDVVIGHFKDSYSRLTPKVIWAFVYALKRYNFVFCMKVDEDSFVNLSYLVGYLNSIKPGDLKDFYAGKPRQGDLAVPKTGKFTLNSGQITDYIQYNLGGGYILSKTAMTRILSTHKAGTIAILPWEDVYIGMLAHVTGIKPTRIFHYYVSKFHPFCTDSQSKLLHHTPPDLQARMMYYYDRYGKYCPDNKSEEEVLELINSYDIVNWKED